MYDKLGDIMDGLKELGYHTNIIRKPTNQANEYGEYHWGKCILKKRYITTNVIKECFWQWWHLLAVALKSL